MQERGFWNICSSLVLQSFLYLHHERQAEVRRILAENGIDYTIKTTNMQGGMQKANMWSAGFNQSFAWEYKIYVHKKDLEYALHLIR